MSFDKLKWYSQMGINTELYELYLKYQSDRQVLSKYDNKKANVDNVIIKSTEDTLKSSSFVQSKLHETADNIDNVQTLPDLYQLIKDYDCSLKKLAKNTVICDGNPNSKLMIIGEAPGEKEDIQGIPFCGESGELLNNMLASIGFSRKDVYITNSFFWRPPANRTPTNDEILSCRRIVEKHIALIKPKLVILVGATAMNSVLHEVKNKSISSIRGQYIQYQNNYLKSSTYATCIFHPAYLLRQPSKKKLAWIDLMNIKKFLSLGIIPE